MSSSSKQQSSRIGEIVQQVKSGQKEKSAAFAELQGILRSSSHTEGESVDGTGPETVDQQYDGGDDYDTGSTSTGVTASRISQEERRMLINKLIEKKRQNRMSAQKSSEGGDGELLQDEQDYQDTDPYYHQQFRSSSSGRAGEASYFTRTSMDDSYVMHGSGDARSNRIAQTEAAIRQEMFKECRFRPLIKELPSFYGGNKEKDSDFYERVTKWQREKDAEAARRKQAMDNSDLIGCTFQPKINRNSERAVKEIRGGDVNEHATDRLYKNSELAINQRSKFIEDEMLRERQEEEANCTFKPKLNATGKKFQQVKSKFQKAETRKEVPPEERPDVKLCTFTPKVKGVKSNMSSAKLYVSTDVVERLTRPIVQGPQDDSILAFDNAYGGSSAMDMASYLGTLEKGGKFGGKASPGARPSSAPPGAGQPIELSDEEVKARREQFQQFLGRQQQQQIKREKHVEQVGSSLSSSLFPSPPHRKHTDTAPPSPPSQNTQKTKQLTPAYQPKLCRKSIELATTHQKGEFLERLERDVLRRVKEEAKKITDPDPECTFKPEISKTAHHLRPRSAFELSRGDLLRKETSARMMKLRTDQELLHELTFKPVITKKAQRQSLGGEGTTTKPSLAADPAQYLLVHKEKTAQKEAAAAAEKAKREQEELEACTFAPSTKDCPAYVKRIAKSMSVMRAAKTPANDVGPEKPTWR